MWGTAGTGLGRRRQVEAGGGEGAALLVTLERGHPIQPRSPVGTSWWDDGQSGAGVSRGQVWSGSGT